jgi:hypothetical protein
MGQIPFGHMDIGRDAWSGLGCLRQCRFRNVCFDPAADEFVLLSGPRLGQGSDIWMYVLGRLPPTSPACRRRWASASAAPAGSGDWARPCHICPGTGLACVQNHSASAASARSCAVGRG